MAHARIESAGSSTALHIGVIREGRFIEDRWFEGKVHVTVGSGEKSTFAFPLSTLRARHSLFVEKQGRLVLRFDEHARGKLSIGEDKELDLAECRKLGLAWPKGNCFEMALTHAMRGWITLGEVSFVFNFSKPPAAPPKRVLPKEARGTIWNVSDHTFLSVLLISFAFHGCMIAAVSRRDLPPEVTLEEIPDRFPILTTLQNPAEEKPKPPEETPQDKPAARADTKPEDKHANAPRDSIGHQLEVARAARMTGLNLLLAKATGDDSPLGNVLKPADTFSDFDKALAENPNLAIATTAAAQPRGADVGKTVRIGDLKTGGPIASAPRLQEHRDIGPSSVIVSEEGAEVDSTSVNKDALAGFIKLRVGAIRNCYESQLKRSPSLRGKIVITFTITPQGTVSDASASTDSMGSDEVTACILHQIKGWHLPFKAGADVTVSFPFLFSPAN